jgi:hypothetical protein
MSCCQRAGRWRHHLYRAHRKEGGCWGGGCHISAYEPCMCATLWFPAHKTTTAAAGCCCSGITHPASSHLHTPVSPVCFSTWQWLDEAGMDGRGQPCIPQGDHICCPRTLGCPRVLQFIIQLLQLCALP